MKNSGNKAEKQQESNRSSRKGGTVFLFLCLIAVLGFLLRLAVSCELAANDPAAGNPSNITDMKTYLDLADGILRGNLPALFYYQPFYYAVFLPLCRLGTTTPYLLILAQSLLGGITVLLAGLSAGMILGRRAAVWSALLCAFSAILVYFTPYALLEVLQAFWITLLFYLTLRTWRKPSLAGWSLCGLVLGLSILTRGNTWCFLPVLLFCVLYREWPAGKKQILAGTAMLVFLVVLPQLPFALYNSVRLGHLSGPSTAGNAVLAIGNNPEGAPAGLELPYPKTYEMWLKREKEISIPKRMLQWFLDEPAAFLEQQFQKFILFWDATDYPNNITEANAAKSSLMRNLKFLPTGILLLLGIAGFFNGFYQRLFLRRKLFFLLWSFIALYALSIIVFYILARFRVPVLPLICISGGVYLAQLFRRAPLRVAIHRGAMAAFALFIVYSLSPLYVYAYEPWVLRLTRPDGVNSILEECPYEWKNAPAGKYLLVTDSSSSAKGGWTGTGNSFTLEKTFHLKYPVKATEGLLVFPVFGTGGSFRMTVNRKSLRYTSPGNTIILIPVPLRVENGTVKVNMEISEPQGDVMFVVDSRRDYGRTMLDGKTIPFEFVCQLLIPLGK
ncbi:MAG: hypothetical protein BWY31_02134 [Lentisphaerae bacterium ADurb.Bin242]|nr:MAG: hypothetical protein BWY31_02134 [Lentisphaerae bacterium ADurb.Bin242]